MDDEEEVPDPNRPATINNTKLSYWSERDRLHIALIDLRVENGPEDAILEYFDDDAREFIEDIPLGGTLGHPRGGRIHVAMIEQFNTMGGNVK